MKKFQKTRKDLEEIDIPLSTNSYKAISHKTLIDLTLESADKTGKLMAQKRSSYKISEETKEKIRKTLKGRKLSTEHIENAVQGRKGYKHSKETKNKIGNANRKIRI